MLDELSKRCESHYASKTSQLTSSRAAFLRCWQKLRQLQQRLLKVQQRQQYIASLMQQQIIPLRQEHLRLHVHCIEQLLLLLKGRQWPETARDALLRMLDDEVLLLAHREEGGYAQRRVLRERVELAHLLLTCPWPRPLEREWLEKHLESVIANQAWELLNSALLALAPTALSEWATSRAAAYQHQESEVVQSTHLLAPMMDAQIQQDLAPLYEQLMTQLQQVTSLSDELAQLEHAWVTHDVVSFLSLAHCHQPATQWPLKELGYARLTLLLRQHIIHMEYQLAVTQRDCEPGVQRFKGSCNQVQKSIQAHVEQLHKDILERHRTLARLETWGTEVIPCRPSPKQSAACLIAVDEL